MENHQHHIIKRGRGRVLIEKGYEYYRLSIYRNKKILWRCAEYKRTKCSGTVTTTEDEKHIDKRISHMDTCQPDHDKEVVSITFSNNAQKISSCSKPAPGIYKETVSSLSNSAPGVIEKIPSFQSIKSSVYRKRNKEFQVKKMCYLTDAAIAVEVPSKYDNFILADYQDITSGSRILVFCNEISKTLLPKLNTFLCDGTFKICPAPFTQMYTIHGDNGSSEDTINIIPLLYVLLTDKRKETYLNMFRIIKSQIPQWYPKVFITDFEEAAIQAIQYFFPHVKHQGCYYHFTNKLWRKAKQLNLKNKRQHRIVGLCCALPYLPENHVQAGWEYIKSQIEDFSDRVQLDKFINYMRFWMKATRVKSWLTLGARHRTTNVVEGWHRAINGSFKTRPATVAEFIKKIKDNAEFYSVNVRRLEKNTPKKRTKKDIENDGFIRICQIQLISGDISVPLFLEKLR